MAGESIVHQNDLALAIQDHNDRLAALEQVGVIPVGMVAYCPGDLFPGWLLCDGSTIDANRYGRLVAYLKGTTLPNITGRVVVGKAAAGTFVTLGATGGAETHTLTVAEMPSHSHPVAVDNAGAVAGSNGPTGSPNAMNWLVAARSDALVGGGAAHSILSPYIVMLPVIKF